MKIHSILIACVVNFALFGSAVANIDSGLVAHYKFDGNTNDSSGKGNKGIASGAIASADRFGSPNSAYSFDGIDDYIDFGKLDISGDLSFSVWFKTSSNKRNQTILGNYESCSYSNTGFILINYGSEIETGSPNLQLYNAGSSIFTNNINMSDGNWHYAAGVFTDNSYNFYVDGILIASESGGYNNTLISLKSGAADAIGNGCGVTGESFFNGSIDDIRIYDRALTQTEVKELHQETTSCTDANTDGSTAAGIAQCKANPASCGIDTSGGSVTGESGTVSANLDIYMPSLNYTTLLGTQNIWVNLNFSHEESGQFYWTLKNYGSN